MDRVLLALQQIIANEVTSQVGAGSGPLQNIKIVYYGDPIQIPESNLPAIALQPVDTGYNMRGSRYDQKTCNIEIRLVVNRKDFYNDTGSPQDKVLVVGNMVESLELQNDAQAVLHTSICGIIQNNPCLTYVDPGDSQTKNGASLSKVVNVLYKFSQDRGFPTYEGVARVEVITIGDR